MEDANNNNQIVNISDIFEESEEENEHYINDTNVNNQTIMPNIFEGIESVNQVFPSIPETTIQSLKRKRESDDKNIEEKLNPRKKRVIKVCKPITNYVKLYTGEELFLNNNKDYKLIMTNNIEPNKLIRNIIKRVITSNIKERIEYLSKFQIKDKDDNDISVKYYIELRDNVYSGYYRELRLQNVFKKLLHIWRINKIDKGYIKEIDPITLSEPEKYITLYDINKKRKYEFDAKSLSNAINASLLYYQNAFASPLNPKNPKTNVEFTYSELISIYYQLQEKGELKWTLSTLRENNFNINRWTINNKAILSISAIKNEINKLDTYDGKELLLDFIITRLEEYNMQPTELVLKAYEIAINKVPNHMYLQKFKPIAVIHYEAIQYNLNKSGTIKAMCLKIFKGQNNFIKDLISIGVLKVIRRNQEI